MCFAYRYADQLSDATGDRVQFAPEFSFNGALDYRRGLGSNLEGRMFFNVHYSDEYFVAGDLDPIIALQDAYTRVDVRASVGSVNDAWEISLIGKNLTDELVSTSSNDQPLVTGNGFAFTDRLRSFAVQATVNF